MFRWPTGARAGGRATAIGEPKEMAFDNEGNLL
jgi:hypothetical protein